MSEREREGGREREREREGGREGERGRERERERGGIYLTPSVSTVILMSVT